jgi:hypothetical protein
MQSGHLWWLHCSGKEHGLRGQTAWVQILILPFTGCVTLLCLSFVSLKMRIITVFTLHRVIMIERDTMVTIPYPNAWDWKYFIFWISPEFGIFSYI